MADAVKLTLAPNGPLTDVLCQRLREHGIPAFYVRPEDVERAKKLI